MNSDQRPLPALPFETHQFDGRIPLNAQKIIDELNRLWEDSSSKLPGDHTHTRVSLLDLIVIADTRTLQRAESMILRIARERPSRTILISLDADESATNDEALSAEVGIACSLGEGSRGVICWEKITIFASSNSLGYTPGAVRSLLSGFNPVVVVDLLPSLAGEDALSELYNLADYVFFDSAINRRKLAAKIEAQDGAFGKLFDLGYERDHPLREVVKQIFDEPGALSRLPRLASIEITYSSGAPGANTRALYLCGWLAAKLKLTLKDTGNKHRRVYASPVSEEVVICAKPSERLQDAGVGRDFGLSFVFSDNMPAITVDPGEKDAASGNDIEGLEFVVHGALNSEAQRLVVRDETLHDAQYILRRLSDSHRRGDYTAALTRALETLHASDSANALSDPQIVCYPDRQRLTQGAAELFVSIMREAVQRRGRFTVALAGGSTPVALYRMLSGSVYAGCSEWSESVFLFGDERSVPPDHEDSNYRMAKENLFDPLDVLPQQVLRMQGESDSLEEAAGRYQGLIESVLTERDRTGAPILDLALLGLGDDGHTASIFPDYPAQEVDESALCVSLWVESKQTHRLTLTPRMLNAARNIVFLVSGAAKSAAVRALLVDKSAAACRIQATHGRMFCLLDSDAAAESPGA